MIPFVRVGEAHGFSSEAELAMPTESGNQAASYKSQDESINTNESMSHTYSQTKSDPLSPFQLSG